MLKCTFRCQNAKKIAPLEAEIQCSALSEAKTRYSEPSWEPKHTLSCPFGWLNRQKLSSWEPKLILKCPPAGSHDACLSALFGGQNVCSSSLLAAKTHKEVLPFGSKHAKLLC